MSELIYFLAGTFPGLVVAVVVWNSSRKSRDAATPLSTRTMEVVKWAETLGSSDEYRRHQAYARLIKEFPDTKRSEIGMAIELAVQRL